VESQTFQISSIILGVALGGLASWIITRYYYRRSLEQPDKVFGTHRRCPRCGAPSSQFRYPRPHRDERGEAMHHHVDCPSCGWNAHLAT